MEPTCYFCEEVSAELRTICEQCADWLETWAVPGPDETVTGYDRDNALRLLDSIQDEGTDSVTSEVFDLIRKCISEGAEHGKCNCRVCRRKRAHQELEDWLQTNAIEVVDRPEDAPPPISGWNYRVVHKVLELPGGGTEDQYAIHEVYYDDQDQPGSCTVEPVGGAAAEPAELRQNLIRMLQALDRPTLEYADFAQKDKS